jgi:hypothetical protein
VTGGFHEREAMNGAPEVQGVAGGATRRVEALEHVLGQIHGEGPESLFGLVVQGARAAALRAEAPQGIEVTQPLEHLLQVNALSQVAEVRPRGGWACAARCAVASPTSKPGCLTNNARWESGRMAPSDGS